MYWNVSKGVFSNYSSLFQIASFSIIGGFRLLHLFLEFPGGLMIQYNSWNYKEWEDWQNLVKQMKIHIMN